MKGWKGERTALSRQSRCTDSNERKRVPGPSEAARVEWDVVVGPDLKLGCLRERLNLKWRT